MNNKDFLNEISNIVLNKDYQETESFQQKLKEQINDLVKHNSKYSSGLIWTLVSAIDAKDPYTAGHSERVADLSVMICKKLNKSKKYASEIYRAALLHDVGKIGIPDSILNKTSKLTDYEFNLIQSHTIKGEEILDNLYGIPEIGTAALGHHEKYDGTGYPNKLKGNQIPEIASIVAVADAYDAMASKRSYRDVLPQAIIREEFVKGTGAQFNPIHAKAMIEIIDEDKDYVLHG